MIDFEVERLRRLRACALRVRAVARALRKRQPLLHDALLHRARCTAWRVARTVSGRLRAHPYASFQKDAGLDVIFANSVIAATAAIGVRTRRQGFIRFEAYLRQFAHALDDSRSLTRSTELSDSFGRMQKEIRTLEAAVGYEINGSAAGINPAGVNERSGSKAGGIGGMPAPVPAVASAPAFTASADKDWPYLAI